MKKFPKIKRIKNKPEILNYGDIVITEKLDGSNTRIKRMGHKILFGSRKKVYYKKKEIPKPLGSIGGQFNDVTNYIDNNVNLKKIKYFEDKLGNRLVFFGENMVRHSLDYNWDDIPQYLGFAIYKEEAGEWINPNDAKEIFEEIGLPFVPIIETVKAENFDVENYEVPESEYRDGKAEGVVLFNTVQEEMAKIKSDEFKEVEGNIPKKDKPSTKDLIKKYITENRIEKTIKKLHIDEERELSMELMEELPMRVINDIFREETENITLEDYILDMKKLRKRVGNKCVSILRDKIKNQDS